jgi:hypothetical protein
VLVSLPDPDEGLSRLLGRLSRGLIGTGVMLERLVGTIAGGSGILGMSQPSIR